MQIGVCSIAALDRPLDAVLEGAARAGLDGIELTAREPHLAPGASAAEIAHIARNVTARGLSLLAYGSYLGKDGPRTAAHAIEEVTRAAALGAPLLRAWAEPGPEGSLEETADLLRAAGDAAEAHDLVVVVERHIGSFADSTERALALLDAVDHPRVALNYQVLDLLPEADLAAQPDDARRLIGRSRYVHVKNYNPPNQPGGPVLPFAGVGSGVLDQRALLAAIVDSGYIGPMSIEFVALDTEPFEVKLVRDATWLRATLAELETGRP